DRGRRADVASAGKAAAVPRRLGLGAQLLEVKLPLDPAQRLVADHPAVPQVDDRHSLGVDDGPLNGSVLDRLLVEWNLTRLVVVLEVLGGVLLALSEAVDQLQVAGPLRRQPLEPGQCGVDGGFPRVELLARAGSIVAYPQ